MARVPKLRNPRPIKPLIKNARDYERDLRAAYVDPMMLRLRNRLAQAAAADQAYRAMDDVVGQMTALPRDGVPEKLIQKHLNGMEGYHRDRVIKTFRSALALDVSSVLKQEPIARFMRARVRENVDLIKTIPPRMHEGLKNKLQKELEKNPFDQARMMTLFNEEYKSTGYNLRRITRDQTSKTISGLTQVRHQQLGIDKYTWMTSADDRVRPSHRDNNGKEFLWADPPVATGHPGHDIMCRCVAIPILNLSDRSRLRRMTE